MLVWLPRDARRDAIGALPDAVRLGVLPADGGHPAGHPADHPADQPDGGAAAADVEVLVLAPQDRDRFAALLPRLTGLRVVQTLNAGVDWVPSPPAGVTLCNAAGVHDGPVAEWVVGVVLAMQKRLPHFLAAQARGHWDTTANLAFADGEPARDVAGSHVLVVGHGSIGRAVEARLTAFGARVTGVARRPRPGVEGPQALPELLPDADVVVLLAPATEATRGLVDAAFLAAMKPGALLVNAARGSLVDTAALLSALHDGRVRAALDATDPEPLPPDHPLWSAPGVLVTPHVAGSSAHWLDRAYRLVGDQLRRLAAGEPLLNVRTEGY